MKHDIKSILDSLPKYWWLSLVFMVMLCLPQGCDNRFSDARYDTNDELQIMNYIDSREDLSTFRELIDYVGKRDLLKTAGTYTLFAPNNHAFENLFARLSATGEVVKSIKDKTPAFWENYFRYHLIDEKINTNSLEQGPLPWPTVLNSKYIITDIRDSYSSIKLNNFATIVEYNIEMSNGYVDITNEVLSPPVETISNTLEKTGKYNIMLDIFKETGLINYLKDSTITLFIERDEVLQRNNFIKDSIKNLRNWAAYHIVADSGYFLNQLTKHRLYPVYPEQAISFSINNLGKYFMNDVYKFDQSLEYGIDRVCSNGIYHSVDTVLQITEAKPATIRLNLYPPGSPYGAQNVFAAAPASIIMNTGTQSYHQNKENMIVAFDAQQVGDYFNFTVPDVPAGKYNIRIIHRAGTTRATFLTIYKDKIVKDKINLAKQDGVFEDWSYLVYNNCGTITVDTRSDVTIFFAMTAFAAGKNGSYCCDVLMDIIELVPVTE